MTEAGLHYLVTQFETLAYCPTRDKSCRITFKHAKELDSINQLDPGASCCKFVVTTADGLTCLKWANQISNDDSLVVNKITQTEYLTKITGEIFNNILAL